VGFRKDSLSPEAIEGVAERRERVRAFKLIDGMPPEQIIERRKAALAAKSSNRT
jgi:hypothetical protein